jgi:L,D-peptidoglycan transpeptidase YkuD (ErfK/YbiS/YcfS/YnhG family)
MTILVKNKHTLQIDEFKFRCCIGKSGVTKNKKEGDKKTPKGTFGIESLYYRKRSFEKTNDLLLSASKLKKIWVGVMIFIFQKNITN